MLNRSRGEYDALVKPPHLAARRRDRPEVLEPHRQRLTAEPDADELLPDAVGRDPLERRTRDDLVVVVELHEPLEPGDLEGVVRHVHVVAVVEDPGLHAALVAGRDRSDLGTLRRRSSRGPRAPCRESHRGGTARSRPPPSTPSARRPAGSRRARPPSTSSNGGRRSRRRSSLRISGFDRGPCTCSGDTSGSRIWTSMPGEGLHAERVQQAHRSPRARARTGPRASAEEDRVVDDARRRGRRARRTCTGRPRTCDRSRGREELREAAASGPVDLDLALDGDVPERHVLEQVPVLLRRRRRRASGSACGCRDPSSCTRPRRCAAK